MIFCIANWQSYIRLTAIEMDGQQVHHQHPLNGDGLPIALPPSSFQYDNTVSKSSTSWSTWAVRAALVAGIGVVIYFIWKQMSRKMMIDPDAMLVRLADDKSVVCLKIDVLLRQRFPGLNDSQIDALVQKFESQQ